MGLGIIDTDLCMWAATLTQSDIEAAGQITGHPVLKAKPGPVEQIAPTWIERVNCWVADNPILAGALIAAGYLIARKR